MRKYLYHFIFRMKYSISIYIIHKLCGKAIILLATPTHGNLGDHAIVYSEKLFIKNLGLKNNLIEITNDEYLKNSLYIKKRTNNNDIIIIDGGGNLGILWNWEDDKISSIIKQYKTNPIFIFPQTCFYDESNNSKERLSKNKLIYSEALNLTISLRDTNSFTFCVNNFNNARILLIPDIALFLINKIKLSIDYSREGILLCFRNDCEKSLSVDDTDKIIHYIMQNNFPYKYTSTIVPYNIKTNKRDKELYRIWLEFASAKLIITDRLHAMVFAAITNTPCLALDNISKKVSGVSKIFPFFSNIKICFTINDITSNINKYYNLKISNSIDEPLDQLFMKLREELLKHI